MIIKVEILRHKVIISCKKEKWRNENKREKDGTRTQRDMNISFCY